MQDTSDLWQDFRSQMPVTKKWAYFDHAAVAPLPLPTFSAIEEWGRDFLENGTVNWLRWRRQIEETRQLCAKLIGADTAEIALIRNTTEGIHLIAEGIPWEPGDEVIVPDSEFPSNLFPWLNLESRGVVTRKIPAENELWTLEDLQPLITPRTRLLSLSWVGFLTGWKNDLSEIVAFSHQHGVKVLLDAIQGVGVLPLNVRETPVDFLAADGHKWQLGPEGAGMLYIRREHLDWLRPLGVGWNSVKHAGDFDNSSLNLKNSADRYEGGTFNMPGFQGYRASLELLQRFGVAAISERIHHLLSLLADRITQLGGTVVSSREPGRCSGILAVNLPGTDPQEVRKRCLENQIVLSCRGGHLRLSPHAYQNEADIDHLINVLGSL